MTTSNTTELATTLKSDVTAALEGTVITKNETSLLLDVNESIMTAVDIVGRNRNASRTIQAALRKLADGKRSGDALRAMFMSLPAVKMLAESAPVKPAKDATAADHETYATARQDRRQLDNVVRGMLRGFEHDDYTFAWGAGQVTVAGRIKVEADKAPELEADGTPVTSPADTLDDEPVEPLELTATPVTPVAPVEPAPAVTARGKSGTADSTTDDVIAAMRGAADSPAKLKDETETVQAIVAMTRKQRLQLIAIVNEHSNLEVQGTIRLG